MLPVGSGPPLVAGATTFPPIQGALWVLGSGGNLSLWQQLRENHTTGLRPEENKPTALTGDENAPLLPPAAASPPEGEILAPLCIEMFMSLEAERRVNLPLRGRCRRQKGCISSGRSPVVKVFLPPTGGNILIARRAIPQPSGRRPVKPTNLKNPRPFRAVNPHARRACPMAIP